MKEINESSASEQMSYKEESLLASISRKTNELKSIEGIVIGILTKIDAAGHPFVTFEHHYTRSSVPARSLIELSEKETGREVALMFEENNPLKPVIMGLMYMPEVKQSDVDVSDKIIIEAERELLLKCGKASVHLKKNGDIVIQGRELLSKASQNNLIRGGQIHLN